MASNLGSPGVTSLEAAALRVDCELLAIFPTPKSFTPGSDIAADLRFALRCISVATHFAGLGANNTLLSFCTRLPNGILSSNLPPENEAILSPVEEKLWKRNCVTCVTLSSNFLKRQSSQGMISFLPTLALWLLNMLPSKGVEEAVKSTLAPTSGELSLFNHERDLLIWLNTKDVVFKLLTADYKADNLTKVIEFVVTVSARRLILQPVMQRLLKFDHMLKEEQKFVHVSIVASVLEGANLSTFSTHLESIIEWLERRQASLLLSQKLSSILNKLPACDKDRVYETRFLDLFWKHMLVGRAQVLTERNDFTNSLINFARHYTLVNNMEQLLDPTSRTHDNAKFLQNCFSQEPSSSSKLTLCLEPNQVETYVQKAKFWEEIEREYLVDIPKREQRLEELLNLIPLNRHEILRDCMEWLGMARSLITWFDNISS